MWWVLWILTGFVLVISLLLISRIYIHIHFIYTKEKQVLHVTITLYHIRIYKKQFDLQEKENSGIPNIWEKGNFLAGLCDIQHQFKRAVDELKAAKTITASILEKMQFHKFSWETVVGTGDAGTTGIAAGGVWIIKGISTELIKNRSNANCPLKVAVHPQFQYRCMQSQADCMVSVKLGQAMGVFLKNRKEV